MIICLFCSIFLTVNLNGMIEQKKIISNYRHPFLFFSLSTFFPWTFWFLSGYISHSEVFTETHEILVGIGSMAGLVSPLVIALFFILPDNNLRKDLLGRFFNFSSVKKEYLLICFFLMLSSILLAQTISLFFGYSVDQFALRRSFTFSSSLFPVWFLLIVAPIFEELAWHSYGTDALLSRYNMFTSSVIFALYWAVWHFPLSTINGYYHSNLIESGVIFSFNFVISMMPFVLIMNWIYYKTNRNVLLTIIFHLTAVFFNEIFLTDPMSKVIQTILLIIFSGILLVRDKELFFRRI